MKKTVKYILSLILLISFVTPIYAGPTSNLPGSSSGGGSMTYPGAGISVSDGSGWLSSYTFSTDTSLGTSDTTISSQKAVKSYVDAKVSDAAYDATSWDGVTGIAPSKNAIRDKVETLAPKVNPTLTAPVETVVPGGNCSISYTPDLTAGSIFTLTLNGACQIANPTLAAGESFTIKLTQSATTAPTWGNAFKWASGTAPIWSVSATKYDIVSCVSFEGTALQCAGIIDVR